MYVVLKTSGDIYKIFNQNSTKITKENFAKYLKNREVYGIIMKRDCDRYALKREVAAFTAGFSVEYVRF